jgi:hypothetical protein
MPLIYVSELPPRTTGARCQVSRAFQQSTFDGILCVSMPANNQAVADMWRQFPYLRQLRGV